MLQRKIGAPAATTAATPSTASTAESSTTPAAMETSATPAPAGEAATGRATAPSTEACLTSR